MTASAINVVTVDLARSSAGAVSQTFTVLVAADLTMLEGVPAPIMVPESGWTISHYAEVWTPDTVHNPVHPQRYEGRWRWAGVFTSTRTMPTVTVSAVPVAQCVGHWDLQGSTPAIATFPELDSGTITVGGEAYGWVYRDTSAQWVRHERFAAGAAPVAAAGTIGPYTTALPIPFTAAGRALGHYPTSSGADGDVRFDRGDLHAVASISGTMSGTVGTVYSGTNVMESAGAGQTWTAGSLDAYDAEIGCTTVPVAWHGSRLTTVEFWEPWTPPEPPSDDGWHLGLPFGGAGGWHLG